MKKIINNRRKRLKIGSVYLIANVINKAIAFITIPIFTRIMTTGEYGTVSTYLSYVSILEYFMGCASEYTVRNAFVDYKNEIKQYMSSMYSLSFVIGILFSALTIALNFNFKISSNILCIMCLIQSYMTYVINAKTNELMMENKYNFRAILLAGPNLLSALLGIIFLSIFNFNGTYERIFGYLFSFFLFGIICLASSFKISYKKNNVKYWKYILKLAPPLIFHGLSLIVLSQSDRIMITNLIGSSETAIYSIVYNLSMVALAITSALEGLWTPWFTKKYYSNDENKYDDINKKAHQYLLITSCLMIGIILIGPEVLKIITPEPYWKGINMIPPLVFASYIIYMYSFCINFEILEKKTLQIAIYTMIAACSNIILNYLLIPKFGSLAAAYTTVFSYFISFVLHYLLCHRIDRKIFNFRIYFIPGVLIFISSCVFYVTIENVFIRWILACIDAFYLFKNFKKYYFV